MRIQREIEVTSHIYHVYSSVLYLYIHISFLFTYSISYILCCWFPYLFCCLYFFTFSTYLIYFCSYYIYCIPASPTLFYSQAYIRSIRIYISITFTLFLCLFSVPCPFLFSNTSKAALKFIVMVLVLDFLLDIGLFRDDISVFFWILDLPIL